MKLDVDFLFTKIVYKSNILTEIKMIQAALYSYQENLRVVTVMSNQQDAIPMKSKYFYEKIMLQSANQHVSLPMGLIVMRVMI